MLVSDYVTLHLASLNVCNQLPNHNVYSLTRQNTYLVSSAHPVKLKIYLLGSKSAIIDMLQVFGDKAFEKFGKGLISLHFSDQHPGIHKKVLLFKFVLPAAKKMADMTRLVALVPYYIDLIGRYKLSSQVSELCYQCMLGL